MTPLTLPTQTSNFILATEPQNEIWISCLLGGEDANRSYNESVSIHLTGALQLAAIDFAIKELYNRHEILRSTFSEDGKEIYTSDITYFSLFFEDISDRSDVEQELHISDFSIDSSLQIFDLAKGPLFRTALFKLGENDHYLTIIAHHIICDGWSFAVIMHDLGKLYSASIANSEPDLEQPYSFREYSIEQQIFSETEEQKEIEEYWVKQFQTVPVLELPNDFPRSVKRTYKSHRDDFLINAELVARLKKTGAKAGCTLSTTLISVYELFLHLLTGQSDIVIGIPTAGQSVSGHFDLVGQCVNLLPIRSFPNGELSFTEYLKKRKSQILNDYDHQNFTFGSLLKKLKINRDASRIPLLPVIFNIDLGLNDDISFEGLDHQLIYNPREYDSFEMFVNVSGTEQKMMLEWNYNTQLYKSTTIRKWMHAFDNIIQTVVNNPEVKIKDIKIFSSEYFRDKLDKWNATGFEYPRDKTLHQLISCTAGKFYDKTAIRCKNQQLSYQDLDQRSNQLARYLIDQGVKPNDIVGVAINRSLEMVVVLLAILKSGAAYLPLDPGYPRKRIQYVLEDASSTILLISGRYAGVFQTSVREILIETVFEKLSEYSNGDLSNISNSRSLAYLLYTSGSTGNPKGVMVEHQNIINLLNSIQRFPGITSEDKLLALTTVSFDMSVLELFLPLLSGAELIIATDEEQKEGHILVEKIYKDKITIIQGTPSSYKLMLETGWVGKTELKLFCGGEALSKTLADKLLLRCTSLYNLYGPTETTIYSTATQIFHNDQIITIGRPIHNTQIYILDTYGNLLAEGIKGEIYIGGDGVARGYLNKPELQAEKFITDPFAKEPGRKMYRTGDVGKFLEDGRIQYLGRNDYQLKIRGFRIEPSEIESKLNDLDDIEESLVMVQEEENDNSRLVAYVIVKNNKEKEDLILKWRAELIDHFPFYMVPNEFIILPEFSLTDNGKIDRNRLVKASTHKENSLNAERISELEKKVIIIWSSTLKIDSIGLDDDFFMLGGHSMIAAQVMQRLHRETGIRLPLTALFEAPTVKKLSLLIEQKGNNSLWKSLVSIKPGGDRLPLYIVHGAGLNVLIFHKLAMNLDPEQPVYGLQARGLNGIDDPFDNMEKIASYYISEILEQNPNGPYNLAGYSFGGVVAFEMAKQLKAMGKSINMVAIFDTSVDNSTKPRTWLLRVLKRIQNSLIYIKFNIQLLINDPIQTIHYRLVNRKYKMLRMLSKFRLIRESAGHEKYLKHSGKINRKLDHAYENYKLTPYNGSVDLFRVTHRMYHVDDPVYFGWKPLALGGVFIHEIPGDHSTFLLSPNVEEFSNVLMKTIKERNQVS